MYLIKKIAAYDMPNYRVTICVKPFRAGQHREGTLSLIAYAYYSLVAEGYEHATTRIVNGPF